MGVELSDTVYGWVKSCGGEFYVLSFVSMAINNSPYPLKCLRVLELLLIRLHMLSLGHTIHNDEVSPHSYSDDTSLYAALSSEPLLNFWMQTTSNNQTPWCRNPERKSEEDGRGDP